MNRVRGYNYLHSHTCIRYLWTYDLDVYGPVCNVFDAGISVKRASGGGWALEIKTFFGPCKIALSRQANAIWGSKKSKASRTGLYQSEVDR